MRVRNVLPGCLVFMILSASSPQMGEASASSSSLAGVDETFGYAPPSQAARRAAARDTEDWKKGKVGEPAPPLKKRSAELFGKDDDEEGGENSVNTMIWVNRPKSEVQEGEQGGSFAGRNRKKLKHRRLDAVDVHVRVPHRRYRCGFQLTAACPADEKYQGEGDREGRRDLGRGRDDAAV